MNKPPAFQFYPKDWLASKSVLRMTPSQCGYFINLLAHAWDNDPPGTLPNDPDLLWKMARAESREKFDSESTLVLEQFPVENSGRKRGVLRFNPKLRSYYRARCTQSKQKSEAAKIRWNNKLHTDAQFPHYSSTATATASASASVKEPPKVPRKPKPLAEYSEAFEKFWEVWPKKVARKDALKAWKAAKVNGNLEKVLEAVERQKKKQQWQDPQYIPAPGRWIREARWEDQISQKELTWDNQEDPF